MAQSRLDRVHASPHLVDKIATTSHKAGISDHCRVEVAFNMGLFNYYVSHLGGGVCHLLIFLTWGNAQTVALKEEGLWK